MIKLSYPPFDFRIKKEAEKEWIFDEIRRQWVRLTPEEWVRQNMLQYLIQTKKYPASLIAIEKEIMLGELRKRFDILVYKDSAPWLIIECKEMNVALNENTLRQALHYNIPVRAAYLIITNGNNTYGFSLGENNIKSIMELPEW